MELRHLRYFVAVAEEMNIRRAAKRLHVSQPPLSRQIQDLEDELGVKLFDRTTRGLALTRAGEAFLGETRQTLSQAERAALLARAANRGETGSLSVAILPPIGGLFLPPVLRAFRERFPSVDVNVVDRMPSAHISALLDRKIDVGFVPMPVVKLPPDLEYEPIQDISIMVAMASGHSLAKRRQLTLAQLAREPLLLINPAAGVLLHDWILNLCREAGFEARVTKLVDGPSSLLEMVSAGFGIALLPDLFQRIPSDAIFRPLPATTPRLHLSVAWRRDNASPLLKVFLDIFRSHIKRNSHAKRGR